MVSLIALLATVGVYGLVAGIVKFDDAGLALIKGAGADAWGSVRRTLGRVILLLAPKLMRLIAVVGMIAMFLVGGGILVHGLPFLDHLLEVITHGMASATLLVTPLYNGITGLIAGILAVAVMTLINRLREA